MNQTFIVVASLRGLEVNGLNAADGLKELIQKMEKSVQNNERSSFEAAQQIYSEYLKALK